MSRYQNLGKIKSLAPCAYCNIESELMRSHSIPKSFFKTINRNNGSGQFISVPNGSTPIHYAQFTGEGYLLCDKCEKQMNNTYDNFIDKEIKNKISNFPISKNYICITTNTRLWAGFIASVLWRSSHLDNGLYNGYKIPKSSSDIVYYSLLGSEHNLFRYFSFSVKRIFDATGDMNDRETLESFILPPVVNIVGRNKHQEHFFVGMGLQFSMFIPRLPFNRRQETKTICDGQKYLIHRRHIFDVPYLLDLGVKAKMKNDLGSVTFKK